MDKNKIEEFVKHIKSELKFDYNLKKLNWFNIGGDAKVFFKPDNLDDLVTFLKTFGKSEKIFVLGAGSNILITDNKFDGFVVKLGKNFSNISLMQNNIIVAGSAVSDKNLSNFAMENNIGGFEFLSCIPGTIGGGLRINSGCFGKEFKDILLSVQVIDRNGVIKTIPSSKIKFGYRHSPLDKDLIFLSASFQGKKKNREEINKEINKLKEEKNRRQPSRIKTGGSTFKNPINQTDIKVWELIKNSIPTTKSFGDAKISEKHCNFLVNSKNAKFEDMMKLINFIKSEVEKKKNIKLETEIEIIE
ncbi:UDP-N-acetylmuramate dehydrogenase [Candidatus Pelagibacter communis]|uniref:UDP-N-acetylmuramate dehydrogenase n=1 Tax=Pelagibacter ubique TaxID=198252 RepID=UPI00094CE451|nr:UDP-N-acetylmuramate dehydrogenase [Candidatus Pelagibacter ubique]